jgi:hypothetical protein
MTTTMKAPCTLSKIIDQMYMKPLLAGTPVSSTNKTDCHNITEILLNTLNTTIIIINVHILGLP